MIQIIDKQLEFLNEELQVNPDNEKTRELIRVMNLFKEIFSAVLVGENKGNSALSLLVIQLLTGKGEVDFVKVMKEFMKLHKLTQTNIEERTGLAQARISEFLNYKHAMQSDTMKKVFSVVSDD